MSPHHSPRVEFWIFSVSFVCSAAVTPHISTSLHSPPHISCPVLATTFVYTAKFSHRHCQQMLPSFLSPSLMASQTSQPDDLLRIQQLDNLRASYSVLEERVQRALHTQVGDVQRLDTIRTEATRYLEAAIAAQNVSYFSFRHQFATDSVSACCSAHFFSLLPSLHCFRQTSPTCSMTLTSQRTSLLILRRSLDLRSFRLFTLGDLDALGTR